MSYPYGANRNVKIFIGTDDAETRKEFSELCGQKKIKNFSVNTNVDTPASSNTGASNQPLITVGMLERINGDEKGDAVVSVRGYEPIWTRFTPSYELNDIYFAAGKADMSKREARLFEKSEYVYDIAHNEGKSEEEKMLEFIDKHDEEIKQIEEQDMQKYLDDLDSEWVKQKEYIKDRVEQFSQLLDGKDARILKNARLEYKPAVLYEMMENYPQSLALEIQKFADELSRELNKLSAIQAKINF